MRTDLGCLIRCQHICLLSLMLHYPTTLVPLFAVTDRLLPNYWVLTKGGLFLFGIIVGIPIQYVLADRLTVLYIH